MMMLKREIYISINLGNNVCMTYDAVGLSSMKLYGFHSFLEVTEQGY